MTPKEFASPDYFGVVDLVRQMQNLHLGLGDRNQAMDLLKKTYEDRDGYSLGFIKIDPFFDPLRGEPRFEAFVAKIFAPK